jgi:hypothetical protein
VYEYEFRRGSPCCCPSDPGSHADFSDVLFDNDAFANSMYASLNDGGVLVCQTGEANFLNDPSGFNSRGKDAVIFKQRLIDGGFKTILEYDDVSRIKPSVYNCADVFEHLT